MARIPPGGGCAAVRGSGAGSGRAIRAAVRPRSRSRRTTARGRPAGVEAAAGTPGRAGRTPTRSAIARSVRSRPLSGPSAVVGARFGRDLARDLAASGHDPARLVPDDHAEPRAERVRVTQLVGALDQPQPRGLHEILRRRTRPGRMSVRRRTAGEEWRSTSNDQARCRASPPAASALTRSRSSSSDTGAPASGAMPDRSASAEAGQAGGEHRSL